MFRRKYLLLNEAGDLGGGAGGLGEGDTPPVDDGGTPPVDDGNSADFSGPEWAKDLQLDTDIANDPSLKAITDMNSLAKSYVHAQRKIGMKGVLIPNENSTQEEWDTFHQKVGVPLEQQAYKDSMKLDLGEGKKFDDAFDSEFIAKAHELRVMPQQATEMYKFFNDKATATAENFQQETEAQIQDSLNALRDTYGEDAYNANLSKALKYVNEELGSDTLEYLKESGLGRNAKVVDMLMKTANKFYKEDSLPSDGGAGPISKDQAQKEINMAMSNPNDPYLKADHPDHSRRVKEIQKFFAILDK